MEKNCLLDDSADGYDAMLNGCNLSHVKLREFVTAVSSRVVAVRFNERIYRKFGKSRTLC